MNYLFIINPGSNSGKGKRGFRALKRILDKRGIFPEYRFTHTLEDAYQLSRAANKRGYEVIVAVGGDGTINRVLNGFYDQHGQRISKARMGVMYTGTSPDFCMSYEIPYNNTQKAVDVLLHGKAKKIQIGKITLARRGMTGNGVTSFDDYSLFQTRYFGCCLNLGIGATVARLANSGLRKIAGDRLGTFVSILAALSSYRPGSLVLQCDGREIPLEKVYNISIGKTYYIASGIKVKHGLSDQDRRFYILIARNLSLSKLPVFFGRLYSGKAFTHNQVLSISYGRKIAIQNYTINPVIEGDGDALGFLPCKIEHADEPLDLICR